MTKHLNARQRAIKYAYLVKRDGEFCRLCYGEGYKQRGPRQLIVERKNNNGDYSNDNIRLAHQGCNIKKNPRGISKFNPDRPSQLTLDEVEPKLIRTHESAVNIRAERIFRLYVIKRIFKEGGITVNELVNAGAEHAGISQQTTKRYLDKMISSEGQFMLDPSASSPTVVPRLSTNDGQDSDGIESVDASSLANELTNNEN